MSEQTISVELTQEQFNHVRTILAQAKPSRTRLTQDEKNFILALIQCDEEALSEADEQDLQDKHFQWRIKNQESIRKKLR